MKRFILVLVIVMFGLSLAKVSEAQTANASPVIVGPLSALEGNADRTILYKNITFPYPTGDLLIHNNKTYWDMYVYIDLDSDTNTNDLNSCYLLGPGESLDLGDYKTEGISILFASPSIVTASDVSVISVY